MRTRIVIDDELMQDTLRATGLKTKREAGKDIAIEAARNIRALRELGLTVRKTIDTVIATRCTESGFALLCSDKDFDPFVRHPDYAAQLL